MRSAPILRGMHGDRKAYHRHHRLRPFPGFPPRLRQGGGYRADLAHPRSSRDFRALYLQPRMGGQRALVRQVLRSGDARGSRHHRAAGRLLAPVSLLLLLCKQKQQDQNRGRPQGQEHRLTGMGTHRGSVHARLAQRRARCHAQGCALVSGRRERAGSHRKGRARFAQRGEAHPRAGQVAERHDRLGRDRLRADRAPAEHVPARAS